MTTENKERKDLQYMTTLAEIHIDMHGGVDDENALNRLSFFMLARFVCLCF